MAATVREVLMSFMVGFLFGNEMMGGKCWGDEQVNQAERLCQQAINVCANGRHYWLP